MSVPIHTLVGFLGAGKTSLLNHLLRHLPAGRRVAVIVNDFGEVPLDGALLERGNYQMKELGAGCICCTLAGPLTDSLVELITSERPDLVLMESTGVARPEQIAPLIDTGDVGELAHCGNIVCVVDAALFPRLSSYIVVVEDQVKCANTVIINKTDLVSPDALQGVRARIEYLTPPEAVILETRHGQVDAGIIFRERPVDFALTRGLGTAHVHDGPVHGLKSLSFELERTFSYAGLERLLHDLEGAVVRAKGIVATDRGPKLFQMSLTGREIRDWRDPVAISRLIFIAPHLDEETLEERIRAMSSER